MASLREKPFWHSSTLWINALGIIAIVLEFIIVSNIMPDAEVVALFVAVLNILNRFRVSKPSDVKTLTLR